MTLSPKEVIILRRLNNFGDNQSAPDIVDSSRGKLEKSSIDAQLEQLVKKKMVKTKKMLTPASVRVGPLLRVFSLTRVGKTAYRNL